MSMRTVRGGWLAGVLAVGVVAVPAAVGDEPGAVPPPCVPDLDFNGVLDLFDILAYFGLFAAADPAADLTEDGATDLFDILRYFALFGEGCPA